MQVVEDLIVRSFPKECPVGVHAVPREKCYSSLRNILLYIGEEAVGRLLGCHGGLDDGGGKTSLAVCAWPSSAPVLYRLAIT